MSFLIAAVLGGALVALPWIGARLVPGARRRQVNLFLRLGVPGGVGMIAAAAVSFVAHERRESSGMSVWWGLVSFGVVAWVAAEYQRWSLRAVVKAAADPPTVGEVVTVATPWLYRLVTVPIVLGWLLLGDCTLFTYCD